MTSTDHSAADSTDDATLDATHDKASGRNDWWFDRLRVTSSARAGIGAAVVLAVIMTASISLAVTSDDDPVSAKPKPVAKTDESYLTPVGTLLQNSALPRPSLSGDTGTAGVPTGTKPRPTTPVATAPTDSGQIATYSGGAGTLTPAGIATLAIAAGCSAESAVTATAVAIAESGGSPSAQGDVTLMDATWDWSAGLWQIRGLRAQRGTGELRDSVANHDPATNAAAMYTISSGCSDWGPWTTYTRGTYESFVALARQAVGYVAKYRSSHGGKLPTVTPRDSRAPIPNGGAGGNAAPATASNGAAGASPGRRAAPRSSTARTAAPGATTGRSGGVPTSTAPRPASSPTPTKSKSRSGTLPTKLPTLLPTKLPTKLPTLLPTKLPTTLPTLPPIRLPSLGIGLP